MPIANCINTFSNDRLLVDASVEMFAKTNNKLIVPPEIVRLIFLFLDKASDFCKVNLVNRACYMISQDPTYTPFNWVLFSPVIERQEKSSPIRLIFYANENQNEERSPILVMEKYVKHNYWKKLIQLFQAEMLPSEEKILDHLLLAADQGYEWPIQHLLIFSKEGFLGINPADEKVERDYFELAMKWAEKGSRAAIEFLMSTFESAETGNQKTNQERLALVKKFAFRGSEDAIRFLLVAYGEGFLGLNVFDAKIQQEGLALAHQFAQQGSEAAIEYLLEASLDGKLGLDETDPDVRDQYLALAREYADTFHSEAAIAFIINSLLYQIIDLNHKDDMHTCLKTAKHYADQGSEMAIELLLNKLGDQSNEKQEAFIRGGACSLAQTYADTFKSEKAITFLLKEHSKFSSDTRTKEIGVELAKKYASEMHSEAAIDWLLNDSYLTHWTLEPITTEKLKKRYTDAKFFADCKSEKAIEYFLDGHLSDDGLEPLPLFDLGLNLTDSSTYKEGLKEARNYLQQGSISALKFLIKASCVAH